MCVGMCMFVCMKLWVRSEERREKQGRDEGRHFFPLVCFPYHVLKFHLHITILSWLILYITCRGLVRRSFKGSMILVMVCGCVGMCVFVLD